MCKWTILIKQLSDSTKKNHHLSKRLRFWSGFVSQNSLMSLYQVPASAVPWQTLPLSFCLFWGFVEASYFTLLWHSEGRGKRSPDCTKEANHSETKPAHSPLPSTWPPASSVHHQESTAWLRLWVAGQSNSRAGSWGKFWWRHGDREHLQWETGSSKKLNPFFF